MHFPRFRSIALLFVLFVLPLAAHAQRILYVDSAATGTGDGTSWSNAFPFLQDALAEAQRGDEIWVAAGTYRPDQGQVVTEGDREASFHLKSGVALYGGFAGTETQRKQRDWLINAVTLSGDLLSNDEDSLYIDNDSRQDNSYSVVSAIEVDTLSIMDGFTIASGNANGSDTHERYGGGLYIQDGEPIISNCVFLNNTAINGGGVGSLGGNLIVEKVSFKRNVAYCGGINCRGGGMFVQNNYTVIKESVFEGNSADDGGGLASVHSDIILHSTSFHGNWSVEGGGMIIFYGKAKLTNVAYYGNQALAGGGGITLSNGSIIIANSVFSGNHAQLYGAGLRNVEIIQADVINSTFSANTADVDGNAIFHGSGELNIYNSILWPMRIEEQRSQVSARNQNPPLPTKMTISHNVIAGSLPEGAIDAGGNIFTDPLLSDPDGLDDVAGTSDDDLSLQSDSPGLDAGRNEYVAEDWLDLDFDLDKKESIPIDYIGNQRIFSLNRNGIVDMGAYEYGAPPVDVAVEAVGNHNFSATTNVKIYPNPFRNIITISFYLPSPAQFSIELYDILGRNMNIGVAGFISGGTVYTKNFDIGNVPPGMYFMRLSAEGKVSNTVPIIHAH